jgi:hypothetical protein
VNNPFLAILHFATNFGLNIHEMNKIYIRETNGIKKRRNNIKIENIKGKAKNRTNRWNSRMAFVL